MDFTGSIIREFQSLPSFWWLWLIILGAAAALICSKLKVSTRKTAWISLLTAYFLFILFETVIGRKTIGFRAELVPFWSYSHPDLYMEIILNYLLFIPLGVLLYGVLGDKLGLKVALIGMGLSALIEITQLVAHIGLFEFDDIFGNTVGCLLGTLLGKVIINGVRSHCNHCKPRREP